MITPEQIRMAKAALGWSNTDLANLAGLHKNTINNAENGRAKESTFLLLKMLFEKGNDNDGCEGDDDPCITALGKIRRA